MKCKCSLPAKLQQVKKQNENHGRYFYCCGDSPPKCNFFHWKENSSVPLRNLVTKEQQAKEFHRRKRKADAISGSTNLMRLSDLSKSYFLFTDGSCIGNTNVANQIHPAGWGVVVVKFKEEMLSRLYQKLLTAPSLVPLPSPVPSSAPTSPNPEIMVGISDALRIICNDFTPESCHVVAELYGPVVLDATVTSSSALSQSRSAATSTAFETSCRLQEFSLGATVTSNNTGELCAIGEAFLWLRDCYPLMSPPLRPTHCFVLYDSEYAAKSVTGQFNGPKNRPLIKNVREQYLFVQQMIRGDPSHASLQSEQTPLGVHFQHIKAHADHYFNEYADRLANQGSSGLICSEGRYRGVALSELDSGSR